MHRARIDWQQISNQQRTIWPWKAQTNNHRQLRDARMFQSAGCWVVGIRWTTPQHMARVDVQQV